MMRSFDLVGTIHGREYSDHGEFVTADDYYHLQLYSEAVDRLKLRLEEENAVLREAAERYLDFRHTGDIGQGYQFSGVHPETQLKAAIAKARGQQ